jgi:outer membrane protein assembly factor BamB
MKRTRATAIRLLLAAAAVCLFGGGDWLHFRGTDTNAVSDEKNLPMTFAGDRQDRNVAWKVPLAGRGPSSPIVVGDRVVVTSATGPKQDRLHVLCFDAGTGKLQWERQLWATGPLVFTPFGGVAAPTPASDGRLIFAFFASNDLACFDLQGNLKWYRGLGYERPTVRNDVGMASSPLVLGPTVIVQLDTPGDSFVAGINTDDGETRWRIDREKGAIWASPTVLRGKTREEDLVLLQSRSRLTADDPQTGKLVWEYQAQCHTISSVTTCGDCVYLPAWGLHALRYDPVSRSVKLLWYYKDRFLSSDQSPVAHGGRVYTIQSKSILNCGDAANGERLWQLRLKGDIWATPVLADGRLYSVNHDGLVQVVELGEKGRLIGTSQVDGPVLATPAVADGAIYFRTDGHLWKVADIAGSYEADGGRGTTDGGRRKAEGGRGKVQSQIPNPKP